MGNRNERYIRLGNMLHKEMLEENSLKEIYIMYLLSCCSYSPNFRMISAIFAQLR